MPRVHPQVKKALQRITLKGMRFPAESDDGVIVPWTEVFLGSENTLGASSAARKGRGKMPLRVSLGSSYTTNLVRRLIKRAVHKPDYRHDWSLVSPWRYVADGAIVVAAIVGLIVYANSRLPGGWIDAIFHQSKLMQYAPREYQVLMGATYAAKLAALILPILCILLFQREHLWQLMSHRRVNRLVTHAKGIAITLDNGRTINAPPPGDWGKAMRGVIQYDDRRSHIAICPKDGSHWRSYVKAAFRSDKPTRKTVFSFWGKLRITAYLIGAFVLQVWLGYRVPAYEYVKLPQFDVVLATAFLMWIPILWLLGPLLRRFDHKFVMTKRDVRPQRYRKRPSGPIGTN